jgi:DNA-binding transcriptional MocR family regulator
VVLTPAHQWPTGVVLAPERRRALIAWATEHDATAVELSGLAAGFHAVGNLPGSVDEQAVVAAARDRSVGLYGMSAYRSTGVTPRRSWSSASAASASAPSRRASRPSATSSRQAPSRGSS